MTIRFHRPQPIYIRRPLCIRKSLGQFLILIIGRKIIHIIQHRQFPHPVRKNKITEPSGIPIIIEDSPVGGIPDKHIAGGGWDHIHRKEGWLVRSISFQVLISEDQTSAKVSLHFCEMILTTLYTSDSSSQQKANVA
ncbi:transducin/WD40 repeat-like superfamily protein [Striga asiatica]|uniref:Transducin/WD40 repeat-like superfamily protein n=1 Tax=Striga asiatica TaxID=4170 RepID=A0A5A7RI72_STRAF|nr:transducin/WD40 repeat-like superfamily protein [Striga asiatica]